MKLSCRLETIASFVPQGSRIADIGTDHGYIPIELVKRGTALSAVAMDLRKGPLERAQEHIRENGLEDRIQTRLSDGLTTFCPGEADTCLIAGMGGGLIIKILSEGRRMWDHISRFILSPQSDIGDVRRFLSEHGFDITREAMVQEDGKYYTVMEAVRGKMALEKESHVQFGSHLIMEHNQVLGEFLEKEKTTLSSIAKGLKKQSSDAAKKRLSEINSQLALIEEAQNEMQRNYRSVE